MPFFYVSALPHELRLTNVPIDEDENNTARLPYLIDVQREYSFQNQTNNQAQVNNPPSPTPARDPVRPSNPIDGHAPIQVDVTNIDSSSNE